MAINNNDVLSGNKTKVNVSDSGNDNSTNDNRTYDNDTTNVDKSIKDSFNDEVELEVEVEVEVDNSIKDSYNDDIDVKIEDSFTNKEDNSVRNQDSFNVTTTFNTQTLNDSSTTVGVRQYQAGLGDLNLGLGKFGAAGLAGGGLDLDNRSLQLDQSVNQIIETNGGGGNTINQAFNQNATTAFGDDSIAAGNNVIQTDVDLDLKTDDINVGNTTINAKINDSFKDYSENYDLDARIRIDDSFNDESVSTRIDAEFEDSFNRNFDYDSVDVEIEDSFTAELEMSSTQSWETDNYGNIFSPGAATTGGEGEFEIDI
ncbi:MAG TPA: hypothetical protein VFC82_05345 [Actinomycetaceae bacterium]|nr:hypothetical protein [Actinomycetaceae bacterium]